ncbi:MAG: ChaN family lipoprotein [Desulfobacteraceae bacterium]|jgi:uncharacterized iron-regulated protein|nr:ChaN family lipoprotein [Desulfobacteraceae bacterium]
MKRTLIIIVSLVTFFGMLDVIQAHLDHRLYDLQKKKERLLADTIADLKKNRIILVGEHHTDQNHHFGQLNIIQSLHEAGAQVAIGLEMFRNDNQNVLDQWIAGNISEKQFEEIYYDNWTYPWSLYRMIFEYARKEQIPMIGLNVPREITRQVSRGGFNSLSEEQKGKLTDVSCRVDKEYMDYIKKAYGAHAHGKINFNYFCEAQMVWDTAMAVNTLAYLKKEPNAVVVLLAGAGHVQKGAVPRQISTRSQIPYAVILPGIEGIIDPQTVSMKDADYIILDY